MTWEIIPLQICQLCSEDDVIAFEYPCNRFDQLRIILFAYLNEETIHCLVTYTEIISSAISPLVRAPLLAISFLRQSISRLDIEWPGCAQQSMHHMRMQEHGARNNAHVYFSLSCLRSFLAAASDQKQHTRAAIDRVTGEAHFLSSWDVIEQQASIKCKSACDFTPCLSHTLIQTFCMWV